QCRVDNSDGGSGERVDGDDRQGPADAVPVEIDDLADSLDSGAVGDGAADGPPEDREQGWWVGAAGAGVAQHDEEHDGDSDAENAEEDLEGHGDRGGAEDEQCAD